MFPNQKQTYIEKWIASICYILTYKYSWSGERILDKAVSCVFSKEK